MVAITVIATTIAVAVMPIAVSAVTAIAAGRAAERRQWPEGR